MIALRIVPVELADPAAAAKRRDGAGVLVPVEGATCWMEHGHDREGWYTVSAAIAEMVRWQNFKIYLPNDGARSRAVMPGQYKRCLVTDDSEIVAEIGFIKGQLVALLVHHFSSPVDETNHFEDTPLLTLPNVREVPESLVLDTVAMLRRAA